MPAHDIQQASVNHSNGCLLHEDSTVTVFTAFEGTNGARNSKLTEEGNARARYTRESTFKDLLNESAGGAELSDSPNEDVRLTFEEVIDNKHNMNFVPIIY